MTTLQKLSLANDLTRIFLLPSEAPLAIVQTDPNLSITCLVPARPQKIFVDYWKGNKNSPTLVETEVQMPALLWTQLFIRWTVTHWSDASCKCLKCSFKDSTELQVRHYNDYSNFYRFFMYAIDLNKSTDTRIMASPYTLANNDSGYVCWGGIPYPYSIRKAQVDYWQSVHNNSPNKYPVFEPRPYAKESSEQLAQFIRDYRPAPAMDFSPFYFGNKHMTAVDSPVGILLSMDSQLRDLFPQNIQNVQSNAFIGFAYHSENGWLIKNSNIEFEIGSDVVIR